MKHLKLIPIFFLFLACANEEMHKAVEQYNYAIGTQAIDHAYKFTENSGLVEMAQGIREMGSNVLKICLETGEGKYNDITYKRESLVDLASNEPSFKTVLDMDFSYYFLWAYGGASFADGMDEADNKKEYDEIYNLTKYLLETYAESGKTFYLGNWEGDWHLINEFDGTMSWYGEKSDVKPEWCNDMTDWFNIRQKAVDDAKRDTEYRGVEVYFYVEICLVESAMNGMPRLVNKTLSQVNPDFVSYSSYDITNLREGRTPEQMGDDLKAGLDYIKSFLPNKPAIEGERILIGEYGYPYGPGYRDNQVASPEVQDAWSRAAIKASLEWGCPFVLQWAFYNNEIDENGKHIGFWMINHKNEKQPVYDTHFEFYKEAKVWVSNYLDENGKLPTREEYNNYAVEAIMNVNL